MIKTTCKFLTIILLYASVFNMGQTVANKRALAMMEQTRINVERVLKEAAKEFDKRESSMRRNCG